jgi:adenylate kinase family enzyme
LADKVETPFALYLKADKNIMFERKMKRASISSDRTDDTLDVFTQRYTTFESTELPLIYWFKEKHALREIDASSQCFDDFYTTVGICLKSLFLTTLHSKRT